MAVFFPPNIETLNSSIMNCHANLDNSGDNERRSGQSEDAEDGHPDFGFLLHL